MNKVLLISVKPEFTEKIFNGSKKIELRKCAPNVNAGDLIIIYCTNPVKAVIGICKVKDIIKTSPNQMWVMHSHKLGIDRKRFREYYSNSSLAIGIALTQICKFDKKVLLSAIKRKVPTFSPPQTFRYYGKSELFKAFKSLSVAGIAD